MQSCRQVVDGVAVGQARVGGDGREEAVADEADVGLDQQEAVELLVADGRRDVIVGPHVDVLGGLVVEAIYKWQPK